MKYLLVALFLIFSIGCDMQPEKGSAADNTNGVMRKIQKFESEGHSYIKFDDWGHGLGVVHDPDCKCGKE